MGGLRVVAAILVPWVPANTWAYIKGYLPLNNSELSLRFPQHGLWGRFVQEMSARVGSTTIRFIEPASEIRLSGVDLSGKLWTVTADALRGGQVTRF